LINAQINWTSAGSHAKKSEEKYWCRDELEKEELEVCVIVTRFEVVKTSTQIIMLLWMKQWQ
jgi:hypothetical protein